MYEFTYAGDLLTRIKFKGSGSNELSYVSFAYTGSNLTSVTDKDGEVSRFTYTTNNLMSTAQDIDGYTLTYTYTTLEEGVPNRIHTVTETDGTKSGGQLTLAYAQNQTTFTDHTGNVQVMQFNNWGNTISIHDDQGRGQYAQYALSDASTSEDTAVAAETAENDTAKGNQLTLSSRLQNTVGNVLADSSFEGGTLWTAASDAITRSISEDTAYLGNRSLMLTRSAAGAAAGVSSASFAAAAGETYTFSAYVKTGSNATTYLALSDGSTVVTSEILPQDRGWTRLEVSYTAAAAVTLTAQLLTEDAGTVWMDCVQVEKAPTASRYNLVENGDFRYEGTWSSSAGRTTAKAVPGENEIELVPAPELSANIYKLSGVYDETNRISQTVHVSGQKDDVFVLAGWAKADSAPLDSYNIEPREFGLVITFYNGTTTVNSKTVRFNPYVDTWQYAAAPVIAGSDYTSVTIELAYAYNVNTAYFDGIQLYKEEFGSSYAYDENGNIKSVKDIQGQTTTYEYVDNDLTKAILPTGAELTYTYDDHHNVLTATTETGVTYTFDYDDWGNNTSVSITSGGKTITSTATYSTDGNRLLSTTDAAGKVTTYSYNADTNVLEWVQYPEDTEATRTEYDYDNMYRLASAAVTTDTGLNLSAEYTYADDLLASIETASTTYSFTYGDFALRSAVQIGERTLAEYTYTSRTNYLSVLDYGNSDKVQYTYDQQGRVTQQTYEDGDTVTYRYDNNGALATVTDSATGIRTTYYYDFTDRLMKYVESDGTNTHSVGYEYDTINNLTKLVETINGVAHETSYTYDLDNRVTSVTTDEVTTTYSYDGHGRVSEREIASGDGKIIGISYEYREISDTSATTGQVKKLTIDASGLDVEYSYTYDDNGNILSVSDGTNTTSYVYDSAGQLIRENNQAANKTWAWTYDRAGNIQTRAEYAYTTASLVGVTPDDTVNYTYGDDDWGDLLTAYDGQTITYDEIGNPLSDGTWTYTWEHGRELMSIVPKDTEAQINRISTAFVYNADGLRTRKTVTVENYHTHSYTSTVVEPTCTEMGYTLHECACGDSYQDNVTAATGHTYADTVVAPTCTEIGYTFHECECGDSYQDNIVVATGHAYTTTVVAPTCTEGGYTVYTCACGDTYQGDETAATGHTYTTTLVAPTCTEVGYTVYTCACGDTYLGDETTATGHTYTTTVVAPTCTEDGYTIHECACGDSYQDSQTAALGHDYATEEVEGGTQYTCTRCDASYLEAHVHSYTSTVVAPTCTENGYTLHSCECGDSYQDNETAATGHTYTTTVVAPTCTEGGYTVYTCACGYSYQGNVTAATGHTYTTTVVAPTCTTAGYTLHECACGDSYQSDQVAATGHSYTTTVVEATCIAAGYTLHECACGDSYQSDEVAALGHNYENSVCTRCGAESLFGPGITKPTFPSLPGIGTFSTFSANGQVLEATIVQTYDYIYSGDSLIQMTVTTSVDGEEASVDTLYFTYAGSTPITVAYNDEVYYYVTNLQGDVVALLDIDGIAVVEYTYDAWGNHLAITGDLADTLGQANPLRYRGYVYDTETGLYYLQSRYYDPEIGRFINADDLVTTGQGLIGNNMFAYCGNRPVNCSDPSGNLYRTFHWQIDLLFFEGFGGIRNASAPTSSSFALYENTEECCGGEMTAQVFAGSFSAPELTDKGFTLMAFDVSLIRCTWKGACFDVDIGNMLNANISADISWSGSAGVNAMLSAWSPSIAVKTDRGTFTYTIYIAAIGFQANGGVDDTFEIAGTLGGIGFGFSYRR